MIDVKDLIDAPERYRQSQRTRGDAIEVVDGIIDAESQRRESITAYEALRAEQNALGKRLTAASAEEKPALLFRLKELAAAVKAASRAVDAADEHLKVLALAFPNLIDPQVKAGGEDDFTVVREMGRRPAMEGSPRDHLQLGELLLGIDMARGAKVAGSRFTFLRGPLAQLERALEQLALDTAIAEGFVPMVPPTLVKPQTMVGTGFDIAHDQEIYRLERDDLYLVGTSEVSLLGYHAEEILDLSAGALRYVGVSTCYRREAGAAGKDTRGIIRLHQFEKVEMFSFVRRGDANQEHDYLLALEERMLALVEIPYRVIDIAAGDLGHSAARKFDCEGWIPSQGCYRELTSTSNCTTFQARRLNIRERDPGGERGTRPVATLNGTLATTRWLAALLENHQDGQGRVRVPEALQPYMGGTQWLEPVTPV